MTASIKTQLVLTAWVASPWLAAQPLDQLQPVDDLCERGVSMPVTDLNTASGTPYAVLQAVGQTYTVSASAALYVSTATAGRYPWHSQGDLGVFILAGER